MLRYIACLGLFSSSLALANPPMPPELIQDQLQQQRLLQQQQQSAAAAKALDLSAKRAAHRCWQAVQGQAKSQGEVLFESTEHAQEERLMIRGKVFLPDEKGGTRRYSYECRMSTDSQGVEGVKLAELPEEPAAERSN